MIWLVTKRNEEPQDDHERLHDMLVLTRKPGQAISLTGGIKVVIKRIGGGQVRVGIEAPEHVRIIRDEIDVEENETVHRLFDKPTAGDDVCQASTHAANGR